MLKEPSDKYVLFELLSIIIGGGSVWLYFVWRDSPPLQCFAVAIAFHGGFFQEWFQLQRRIQSINFSKNLSFVGILVLYSLFTIYFWYTQKYILILFTGTLCLGNIAARLYFKRSQLKGK